MNSSDGQGGAYPRVDHLPQLASFIVLLLAVTLAWPALLAGTLFCLLLRRHPRLGWTLEALACAAACVWLLRAWRDAWRDVALPQLLVALRALLVEHSWRTRPWPSSLPSHVAPQLASLWLFSLTLAPLISVALLLRTRKRAVEDDVLAATQMRSVEEQRRAKRAARQARRAPSSLPSNVATAPIGPAALGIVYHLRHSPPRGDAQMRRQVILGAAVSGDLAARGTAWRTRRGPDGGWVTAPARELALPGVIIGASGSGKTETALRLAAEVAGALGWQVIYLDAKGDYPTAARFLAALRTAGIERTAMFPARSYDGWRGDAAALLNRLLATQDFTEEYYQSVAKQLLYLTLTLPHAGGPPRSAPELLRRLQLPRLQAAYERRPEVGKLAGIDPKQAHGVLARYDGFFTTLSGKLDGDWAYEDVDAAYLLLDGLALKEEAASLGKYLLEDFAHYVAKRKELARRTLLIIDEYSALALQADAANLFERLRSYGASVFVTAQSYAGLGAQADRILASANLLALHRTNDPHRIIERAGMAQAVEASHMIEAERMTGRRTLRRQDRSRVDPDMVRRLEVGEAILIAHGRSERIYVAQSCVGERAAQAATEELRARLATSAESRASGVDPAVVDLDGERAAVGAPPAPPQLAHAAPLDIATETPIPDATGASAVESLPTPTRRKRVRTRRRPSPSAFDATPTPGDSRRRGSPTPLDEAPRL